MQERRRRRSAERLAIVAGTVALLMAGGQLSAQAPDSGGVPNFPAGTGSTQDERLPRLLAGPNGEVFRLWQREPITLQDGAGAVLLAVAAGQDGWRPVLEINPRERGDMARSGDLAFGADGQVAVAYQWWRDNPRLKQVRLALSNDGGTRCSSAYKLALEHVLQQHPASRWNIYLFHFSDGDNLPYDNAVCKALVQDLLVHCNMVGYGEIQYQDDASFYGWRGQAPYALSSLQHALDTIEHPRLLSVTITHKEELYHVLQTFLRPQEGAPA